MGVGDVVPRTMTQGQDVDSMRMSESNEVLYIEIEVIRFWVQCIDGCRVSS